MLQRRNRGKNQTDFESVFVEIEESRGVVLKFVVRIVYEAAAGVAELKSN
jgi:hypothetical protein